MELKRLDPDAYLTNYVYNTRKCDFAKDDVEKLVFFFIVGTKGDGQ